MKNTIIKHIILLLIASIASVVIVKAQDRPIERMHVHLPKHIYIAGEAIQFKLYCINPKDQKLSNISLVAYVELIGENGFPVAQTDVILKQGMGEGGFVVSSQLPTGNYAINAYTHWMKTSSPDFINISSLFIYNNQNISKDLKTAIKLPDCTFRDLKDNSKSLLNTNTKPQEEEISIHTKIEDINRTLRFSVSINNSETQSIAPYRFQLYSKDGKILDKEFQFINNSWELRSNIKELESSNYSVCIRDKENKILKTAVVHLARSHRGRFIEKPRITTSKRKKIKISLHLNELNQQTDSLFLSAGIRLKEPNSSSINIIDYVNLYSDFGASMLPYFKQIGQIGKQNWIVENGPETLWVKHSNSYSVNANRYPETESYVLEGAVNYRDSKLPVQNENIFLSRIGAYADIRTYRTDDQGKFFFKLPLKKGLHDISIQVSDKDDLDLSINLKDKFSSKNFAPLSWNPNQLKGEQLTFIKELYENFRIRNIYQKETFKETNDTCLFRGKQNFFGKAKRSIKIDEYIRLDSLEEYFHEFLGSVKIKYKKKQPYMNVFNLDLMQVMKHKPLLMYDGLILSDASIILNKDSKDIDKIEVVPYEYYYGSSHLYGIINVISKTHKCEINELPKNTERYYLPLFTKSIEFLNQKIPQEGHRPDFRTDLLWEPNINLTKDKSFDLEFTSSDVKGEYELTVEGISEKGEPIVIKQSILVE